MRFAPDDVQIIGESHRHANQLAAPKMCISSSIIAVIECAAHDCQTGTTSSTRVVLICRLWSSHISHGKKPDATAGDWAKVRWPRKLEFRIFRCLSVTFTKVIKVTGCAHFKCECYWFCVLRLVLVILFSVISAEKHCHTRTTAYSLSQRLQAASPSYWRWVFWYLFV